MRKTPPAVRDRPNAWDIWLWGVALAWGIETRGRPPFQRGLRNTLLDRAAARALPRQGWEQAPPERDSPSARPRAHAMAMLAAMLASAALLGAAVGLTAASLQGSSAVGRRGGPLVATVVAAWGPGLATATATGGAQLRPRGRGEGGFAGIRVGEAAHPGPPRDGNEPPHLHLPAAVTPDSALRRGRRASEERGSRSARRRDRPRPRSSPPAAAEEEASPPDEVLLQRVRSLDLRPPTPPASGRPRRRLDMDGATAAGPPRPAEEVEEPPPAPARVFCPVAGCAAADPARAAGWQNVQAMRPHLEEHMCGHLVGAVPPGWLDGHALGQCTVCSRVLSRRYGNTCPRCRPALARPAVPVQGRPLPDGCPTLDEVCAAPIGVRRHVPKGAQNLWAQCLLTAAAGVVEFNDTRAWTEFMALPKMVLVAGNRGGKGHRRRADNDTKRRCRDWLEGQRELLWRAPDRGGRAHRQASDEAVEAERHRRATELLHEGLLQQASATLVQAPPVRVTDAIEQEMRLKHPAARHQEAERLAGLRAVAAAAAIHIDEDALEKALHGFSPASAGGPSGLRPQHIKEAMAPGLRDEVRRHLAAIANRMARGEVPSEVRAWLCGASLTAVPKPSGGHRPIAVGEAMRRLTAKALASTVAPAMRELFEPVQLGVGTPGGAEASVHVARQWMSRNAGDKDKVLVTIDVENAFNMIDRSAFLSEVRRTQPGLAPWVDFCYADASHLLLDSRVLASERGIQQGDPLGPALFALAVHTAILEARDAASGASWGSGLLLVLPR